MCPGKAPSAGNGHSLGKNCNAVWAHLVGSLRARREGVILCVAPLGKGATNDDRPDLMLALLGLLSQSAPEERDEQLSALQAENARLRSQIDGYERGRFIRFMAWLRARRAREYKGVGS